MANFFPKLPHCHIAACLPLSKVSSTTDKTKIQVVSINTTPIAPVTLNGEPLEVVEGFTYLGSLISKDNGAQKYIKDIKTGKSPLCFCQTSEHLEVQAIYHGNKVKTLQQ